MMNKDKYIPQGYKPSPLGLIPEDWEVKRLGEICDIDKESLSSKTDPEYKFDYISLSDVDSDNFEISTSKQIFKTAPSRARRIVKKGDVIISTVRPNLQAFFLIKNNVENLIVSTGFAVLTPQKNVLGEYLIQYVFSDKVSRQFFQLVVGSNYPAVNSSDIAHLKLAIPPIKEQENICNVLQLWDTAIAKQTALIEKLTLRKRGLMQQLLTGKKRLKGFSGEWKEVRLGEVASINRGGSPRPIEKYITKGEGYNWIKIGDVDQDAKYITSTEEKIIKEGLTKTRFVRSGDFILSNSMSFGRPYILKIDGCIHDGWLVIQEYDKTFDIDFLYYILGYDTTLAQYKSMAAGSGVLNLNKEIVKEVMLNTPSIDEQKAIASILINADKEIEIANEKLLHMQEEKHGLMQVLLTGKKRIK